MQKMSENFVNALSESIQTSVLGFANTMEMLALYGNLTADTYQPDGIEAQILNHSVAKTALADGGSIYDVNAALTLTHLDNALDHMTAYRGSMNDRLLFIMSRNMISRVSGLQTRVNREVQSVEYEGGFRMATYRGVPLLPSDLLVPQSTTTSPAVTATAAAGGALADGTYHYRIASVTLRGEQFVGAADSATTATTNNSVDLTWTADAEAKLYKIYRGTTATAADMRLLAIVPAVTYDANGTVNGTVATWSDEGAITPNAAFAPAASNADQTIYGINISGNERGVKIMGAVSPLGDPIDDYVTLTPLATTNASFRFMIEGFLGFKVPYPGVNVIMRRAKLS